MAIRLYNRNNVRGAAILEQKSILENLGYSHSMVPGGFDVTS